MRANACFGLAWLCSYDYEAHCVVGPRLPLVADFDFGCCNVRVCRGACRPGARACITPPRQPNQPSTPPHTATDDRCSRHVSAHGGAARTFGVGLRPPIAAGGRGGRRRGTCQQPRQQRWRHPRQCPRRARAHRPDMPFQYERRRAPGAVAVVQQQQQRQRPRAHPNDDAAAAPTAAMDAGELGNDDEQQQQQWEQQRQQLDGAA